MKKIYLYVIVLLGLFIPISVNALEGISKFYADATINKDGSVLVKEAFILNGDYSGFERIIKYANESATTFNPSSDSYGGSSLHDGADISIGKIMAIDESFFNNKNFDLIAGDKFEDNPLNARYGYYSLNRLSDGVTVRIHNPSSTEKAFYLEYLITDLAILHNDTAELGWNLFGTELKESIGEYNMTIHLPDNKNDLKAWAHGPLNGNVEIIDRQTVKVTISDLASKTAMDVRLAFDKEVVFNSIKVTNTDALSKILVYEQEKADVANQQRKEARFKYYGTIALAGIWVIGLFIILFRTYKKYDKEYKSNFDIKYYREFPNTYGPEIVGYLMNKKIGTNELSASILNLVYKKVMKVEKVTVDGKKEDYEFIYQPEQVEKASLTTVETNLISWLFASEPKILLSEFQDGAKKDYTEFLSSYNKWKDSATAEAVAQNFYEISDSHKMLPIIYSIIGIVIIFILSNIVGILSLGIICLFIGVAAIIYCASFTKRTQFGNEEHAKWNALKNFLVDFGNFSDKELPEIALWEKYLVYAVTLKCASKLSKTMEIKAKELYPDMGSAYYPSYNFYYACSLNRAVNNGINSAVSNAISTQSAAQSSNSSGSGFGGGFSGGGGSFGGGGGGGRF